MRSTHGAVLFVRTSDYDGGVMRSVIKFPNLAVFIIFFSIALIEALQKQNWLEAALGVLSLWADFREG